MTMVMHHTKDMFINMNEKGDLDDHPTGLLWCVCQWHSLEIHGND